MGIFTQGIIIGLNRYIILNIEKKNLNSINEFLSTAIIGFTIISLSTIPLLFILIGNLEIIINIPNGIVFETKLFFVSCYVSVIITFIGSVFNVVIYSNNRIDLIKYLDVISHVIKLLLTIILLSVISKNIFYVGVAYIIGSISFLIMSMYIGKYVMPEVKISAKYYSIKKLKKLISLSFWLILNQIGVFLFHQVDVIICNKYIDYRKAGDLAAILQVSILMRQISGLFSELISPLIINLYGKNEKDKIINLTKNTLNMLNMILMLMGTFFLIFKIEILSIWLEADKFENIQLVNVIVAGVLINASVIPLFTIHIAYKKLIIPTIANYLALLLKLIFCFYLINIQQLGVIGLALGGIIALSLKNLLFTTLYTSILLEIKKSYFIKLFNPILIFLSLFFITEYYAYTTFSEIKVTYKVIVYTIIIILSIIYYQSSIKAFQKYINLK